MSAFAIQSQIAESIAKELKAVITPQEKGLIEKIPTTQLDAYGAYLKGQFYWKKLNPNDLETALKYFELAKEKDPGYALAYAGICIVWLVRQQMGSASPDVAGPKAVEAIMKALELDNPQAEIHFTLAGLKTWGMWDWEGGEAAFRRSIELNPNHAEAHAYYAHLLNILGKPEEALEYGKVSLKLDPHNPLLKSLYSADLMFARHYDEAIIAARDALKIDPKKLLFCISWQEIKRRLWNALKRLLPCVILICHICISRFMTASGMIHDSRRLHGRWDCHINRFFQLIQ